MIGHLYNNYQMDVSVNYSLLNRSLLTRPATDLSVGCTHICFGELNHSLSQCDNKPTIKTSGYNI